MDAAVHILNEILEELRETNKKLDDLGVKIEKITAFGECDLQGVCSKIDDVTLCGSHSLADVCQKIGEAADTITAAMKKEG